MPPTTQHNDIVNEAIAQLRSFTRRGAYGEAVAFDQALSPALQHEPTIALLMVRTYMNQGDMQQAETRFAHIQHLLEQIAVQVGR